MAEKNAGSLAPMTELFDFLTERGVLSALYLASLSYPLIVANRTPGMATIDHTSVAVISTVLGLIISKITYEFLLDTVRPLTERIVLKAFRDTVDSGDFCPSYRDFRAIREGILGRDVTAGQQYLKERILKNQALLHTVTYLFCANLLAAVALVAAVIISWFRPDSLSIPAELMTLELCVVVYVLVATVAGEKSRSAALGRSVAHAYLELSRNNKTAVPLQPNV